MQNISEWLSLAEKNIKSKVTSGRKSVSELYINSKTLAALEKWKEDWGKNKFIPKLLQETNMIHIK